MSTRPQYNFRDLPLLDQVKGALLWPYYTLIGGQDIMAAAVGVGYMYYMGTLQFAGVPVSQILMNIAQAGIPVYVYAYAMNIVVTGPGPASATSFLGGFHGASSGLMGRMSLGGQASASLAPGMSYAPGPMMG